MNRFILPMIMAAFLLPVPAKAEMSAEQKKEVEAIIQEYLLNNGKTIIDSVQKFQEEEQARQAKEDEEKFGPKVIELAEKIKKEKTGAEAGNPDGDIVIVEFYDYNCGWCKKAWTEIQAILKDDKNVRVVFYDIPVLGPDSLEVAKWSLASKKQNKFFEFHSAVMNHPGQHDVETLKKLAGDAGLNVEKLEKDKASPDIEAEIKSHLEAAASVGIQGTPGFLINDRVFRGYIPYDVIQSTIKELRAAKK